MSPDIAKALAKLANGLYVVTAAHSDKVCASAAHVLLCCLGCAACLVSHLPAIFSTHSAANANTLAVCCFAASSISL